MKKHRKTKLPHAKVKDLKVGMLVTVHPLKALIKAYGERDHDGMPDMQFGFPKPMAKACGKTLTIKEIERGGEGIMFDEIRRSKDHDPSKGMFTYHISAIKPVTAAQRKQADAVAATRYAKRMEAYNGWGFHEQQIAFADVILNDYRKLHQDSKLGAVIARNILGLGERAWKELLALE